MPWPSMMPEDLRSPISNILASRNPMAADVWTEVRDWLIKHGVKAPDLPPPGPLPWIASAMRDQ
jgi:hypothetical protein